MKKFYETPAVEFTGFNAEDVITTSVVDTITYGADIEGTKLDSSIKATANANAISYNSYNW